MSRLDAGAALAVLEQAQLVKRLAEVQEALAILRVVATYRHQLPNDKIQLAGEGTGLVECVTLAEYGRDRIAYPTFFAAELPALGRQPKWITTRE